MSAGSREGSGSVLRREPLLRPYADVLTAGTPSFAWTVLAHLAELFGPRVLQVPVACGGPHSTSHAMWVSAKRDDWRKPDADATLDTSEPLLAAANTCGAGQGGAPPARFIGWILAFRCEDGEVHGNAVLLDRRNQRLVRFEPRGARLTTRTNYEARVLDRLLDEFARRRLCPPASYLRPAAYQTDVGGQTAEVIQSPLGDATLPHTGPCVSWSLLFIHCVLLFPDVPLQTLVSQLSRAHTLQTLVIEMYARYLAAHATSCPSRV